MIETRVAIVGAGMSGLSLAHHLRGHATVTLFEKSRGAGGRMSTRSTDAFQFDHGAQFFTARSKQFKRFLSPFIENNIVQEWKPKIVTLEKGKKPYKRLWFEPHYVAAPKMNSLCRELAKEKTLILNTQIAQIIDDKNLWLLLDKSGAQYGPFDWVVVTAPAPQTKALLPDSFEDYESISTIVMTGCFCMMIGLNEKPSFSWSAATVKGSPIDWIAVDSSKPHRDNGHALIVHSTNEWAEENMEENQENVMSTLNEEVATLLSIDVRAAAYHKLHRGKFAKTQVDKDEDDEPQGYFIDQSLRLAACGDWCLQGHVESAYLSAYRLASVIKEKLLG